MAGSESTKRIGLIKILIMPKVSAAKINAQKLVQEMPGTTHAVSHKAIIFNPHQIKNFLIIPTP